MATRNDIEMRITADSRGVAAGLKPMMTSLDQAAAAAENTEAALDAIGTTPIKVRVNDEAIAAARAEITRLRNQMREDLRTDVTANTKDAERRIKDLQRTIKVLDAEDPVVDVTVRTTRLDTLRTTVTDIQNAVAGGGGIGGGGLIGGLSAASRGLGAVGGEAAAAAAPVAAVGAAMVVAGGAAWKLGQNAADAETSIAQLDALTSGMGAETFANLQTFAATTPFEMDEVTAATKRLLAAGVQLKDIPDNISDLGEVASATGVPLEQVATVFGQMVSKGKASYEELQQLAEAGIPVWRILADRLHLSVAQVQQLATEGKLGADAIDLLRESLAQTYSGAMARQAQTFNGQMSTLHDNINQTGQAVGTTFLPAMKDLVAILNESITPLLHLAQAWAQANTAMENRTGFTFTDIAPLGLALDVLNGGLKDTADTADDTADSIQTSFSADLVGGVIAGLTTADDKIKQAEADAKQLAQEFQDAVDAFEGIGTTVRARVDFIISKDDIEDEIRKITEGTKDQKPVTLPAELKIGQIAGLTDVQQDLVGSLSDFVQTGLEEGARRATIDPTFNADDFYRDLRKQLRPLVIEAGIDPKNVNEFLDTVLGVPAPWKVDPQIEGFTKAQANAAAAGLFPDASVPVDIVPRVTGKGRDAIEAALGIDLGAGAEGPTATITTDVAGADVSRAEIDEVANPGGTGREALIGVRLAQGDMDAVRGQLSTLGIGSAGAAGGVRSPDAIDRGPTTERREPARAPRIVVQIDGEDVATHLERRGRQLAATGGRRNP